MSRTYNLSVEELAQKVREYAGYVQNNLDDSATAHDYMNDLSIYVDELRERLWQQVYNTDKV